jgi:hypothetical protein
MVDAGMDRSQSPAFRALSPVGIRVLAVIEAALVGNQCVALSHGEIGATLRTATSTVAFGVRQSVLLRLIKRVEPHACCISRFARCDDWRNIGELEAKRLKALARPKTRPKGQATDAVAGVHDAGDDRRESIGAVTADHAR